MDITNIECRTPRAGEWVQVNPDPDSQKEVTLVYDEGVYYLVAPEFEPKFAAIVADLPPERAKQVQRSMLFLAANREGKGFLWPVKLPVPEEHLVYQAMREWVCLHSLH